MKKDEQLVKLAAKKFLQQKGEEILTFLKWTVLAILGPFGAGLVVWMFLDGEQAMRGELGWFMELFCYWAWGVFALSFLALLIGLIWAICKLIKEWIESNFEKAIKEAKKELKIK